jgi:hypothetical protein
MSSQGMSSCIPSSTLGKQPFKYYFGIILTDTVSRGSAVGIVTSYGLDNRRVGVRVLVGSEFSLLRIVQTGSVAHAASYPMGTRGKATGA